MEMRDLLEQVASGRLAPDEALEQLDRPVGSVGAARTGVAGIDVVASGVRLVLVADPLVATAMVDGPHRIRQDGARLRVELPGEPVDGEPGRVSWRFGGVRVEIPGGSGQRVRMRVNPALPVRLELDACHAKVAGLTADLDVEASSSSLKVDGQHGAVRGRTSECSASIAAVLTRDSDLVCNRGSLTLALLPGSDATVTATAEMGSVKFLGGGTGSADRPGVRGVGAGRAAVAVWIRRGSAKVLLP